MKIVSEGCGIVCGMPNGWECAPSMLTLWSSAICMGLVSLFGRVSLLILFDPYSKQLIADNSRTRTVVFCRNASPTSFRPPAAQISTCRFDSEHRHLGVSRRVFTRPALELVQKEPPSISCNSASRRGRLLSATPRSCCHLSLPGLNNFRTIR